MQKTTLLVLFALVAVEATFCSRDEESISSAHEKISPATKSKVKWDVDVPYPKGTRGPASPTSPIAKETLPATKTMAISSVSGKQFTGSVQKKFKWDVNIPYGSASAPSTQVLVLNVAEKPDARLIIERKMNKNLDWTFYNWDNGAKKNEVKAHKSLMQKYSPYISNMCQEYAARGEQINSTKFYHQPRIVEIVMTLLYEHSVNTNKSDYDSIMACARALKIENLIEISKDRAATNTLYLR